MVVAALQLLCIVMTNQKAVYQILSGLVYDIVANGNACPLINTVNGDPGMPFRATTSDAAIIGTWTRPTNDVMESNSDEMSISENVNRHHLLLAGERSGDISVHLLTTRLCLSYFIYGVMAQCLMADGGLPPFIIDLIPCYERRQGSDNADDFDEDLGSVSIVPIVAMAQLVITYIVFLDGMTVLEAFLSYIDLERDDWIVVSLTDKMITMFNPIFDMAQSTNGQHSVHVYLVKDKKQGE